ACLVVIHIFSCPIVSFSVFVYLFVPLLDLLSFPTRRSSDLLLGRRGHRLHIGRRLLGRHRDCRGQGLGPLRRPAERSRRRFQRRSEEHTSELQSRFDLVCRLLLEKKNKRSQSYPESWIPS